MHLTVFKQIQTNSCHWYQLCRMHAASVVFKNRKYAPGQQPPCLRSTHTPQILCTGWPGGRTSHPIICQKDDWYKTALRNESSIRALSPSQNDNYWFLLRGIHPREKTSKQNTQLRYVRRSNRHTGKPKRERARSASWELPQWDMFSCCTVSPSVSTWKTSSVLLLLLQDRLAESHQAAGQPLYIRIVHWILKK